MVQASSYLRSPSPSPSLTAVDSSPPSSPGLAAITPPVSPGTRDPFAGSTKSIRRPRIYERHGSQKSIGSGSNDLTADVTPTRSMRVVDPLSGSAKPEWVPPTYEKKTTRTTVKEDASSTSSSHSYAYANRSSSGYTSPTPKRHIVPVELDEPDDFSLTDDEADLPNPPARPKTREELEEKLWDEAIANAIDKLNGTIDLSGSGLGRGAITHIPSSIADLESFMVLPQTHSPSSAPPSPTLSPVARTLTRAATVAAPHFDAPFFRSRDGERLRGTPAARVASAQAVVQQPTAQRRIQIYLANNSITKLPPELFRVNALTVLSLRSNELTFVPSQIAHLKALQELNLAQNKLRWLPSEMLSMRLKSLTVSGNPWLSPPPPSSQQLNPQPSDGSQGRKPVSDTVVRFIVPPLSEICLRILVAPSKPAPQPPRAHPAMLPPTSASSFTTASSSSRHTHTEPDPPPDPPAKRLTVLESSDVPPIGADDHYSPALLNTLRACVPAAVARPAEFERHGRARTKVRRGESGRDVHSARETGPPGPPAPARERERGRGRGREAGDLKGEDGEDGDVFAAPRAVQPEEEEEEEEEEEVTGVSECPSPAHGTRGPVFVFVRHAEERWTWEEAVAGVQVGAEGGGTSGGGGVPVRWRGCSRGCLAFLDPLPPKPEASPAPPAPAPAPVQVQVQRREREQVDGGDPEEQEQEPEVELELDLDIGGVGGVSGDFGVADVDMEDVW